MVKILKIFIISMIAALFSFIKAYAVDYSSISISYSEYPEIAKVVAGESQNDKWESQLAVVEVIFNRCLDNRFPDTPYEVVSQKGQFTVWKMRNAKWIEIGYGDKALSTVFNAKTSSILPSSDYVVFSTKKQSYGYDYIKIGKTWFGKMR